MKVTFPLKLESMANARLHWAQKAKRVKAQRFATQAALSSHIPRSIVERWRTRLLLNEPGLNLAVRLTRIAPRSLDTDNLQAAFKAVRDEVAAQLGIDDRDRRVVWWVEQAKGAPKTHAVEIEIREVAVPASLDMSGFMQRLEDTQNHVTVQDFDADDFNGRPQR